MRVVSMVPSWTETLIEAGVEVVGRTRFCIHPAEEVKAIPVVGGTKDIDWEKLSSIEFDLLLLDKEENLKEMAEEAAAKAKCTVVATHVKSCGDVIGELRSLSKKLNNAALDSFADRWESAIKRLRAKPSAGLVQLQELEPEGFKKIGIESWIKRPTHRYDELVYVIWKNPYMAVTKETFIGSMLELVGLSTSVSFADTQKHYPEIDLSGFEKANTLFLFSSEPFPFHKKISELEALDISSAIVDGESYSWFGVRALKFLENLV